MKYKIQIIGDGGEILQQAWLPSAGGSHDLGSGVFDKGTSELLVGWSFLPDVRSIPRAGEAIRAPFHAVQSGQSETKPDASSSL